MRKSIAEVAKLYGEEYKRFFECVDFLAAPDSSTIKREILGWCVFWESIDRFGGANIVKTYNGIEFKYNLAEQSAYKDGSIISKGEFFDLTGESFDEFF